ncbi:MAG TPA: DUF6265 family protein [Planctomycetota bacterium]|nr:DUF6265 family protein [Planctomycetota bacterium]
MTLLQLALFAGLVLLPGVPQEPHKLPPAAEPKVDRAELQKLAWISGTWVVQNGGKTTEEHWRPLQGTTLLGSSHTFDETKTHFFEHLRITAMRGTIAYVAMPGGAKPTVFTMTKNEAGLVEFENPEHDHPQRIRYEKTADGITATISQLDGSRAQSFVFKKG